MTVRRSGFFMSMALVMVLGAVGLFVPAACASTPIAAMAHDEPAGSTTMTDAVDSHHGSLQNLQIGAPGFQSTGYRFNGSSSVAVVPASSAWGA
jgi:hypothetical protein